MAARFAGSGLDDRRRRRLAHESAAENSARRSELSSPASAGHDETAAGPFRINADESLVPRSPWKIAVIVLGGLVAWAVMLWVGTDPVWTDSAVAEVVSLTSGRTTKFFSTVSLLTTSQLCTMILWYRSKSRKDFSGRYRLWAWGAIYWSLVCMGVATGFHLPLSKMIYDYWQVECWRPETLYWLMPTASGYVALHALLGCEIRQSRVGMFFWNVSAALAAMSLGVAVGLDLSFPPSLRPAVNAAIVTLWHYSAAVAFLVHARFVVHVNNEAVPRRQRQVNPWVASYLGFIRRGVMLVRLPRLRLPGLRLPKLRLPRPGLPKLRLPKFRLPQLWKVKPRATTSDAVSDAPAVAQKTPSSKPKPVAAGKGTEVKAEASGRKLRVDVPQTAPPSPKSDTSRRTPPESQNDELDEYVEQSSSSAMDRDENDRSPISRKHLRKLRRS